MCRLPPNRRRRYVQLGPLVVRLDLARHLLDALGALSDGQFGGFLLGLICKPKRTVLQLRINRLLKADLALCPRHVCA